MKITIQIRNVYGENKAYPVCDAAQKFAAIAGTKTLTRFTLWSILELGYDIEIQGAAYITVPAGAYAYGDVRAALPQLTA